MHTKRDGRSPSLKKRAGLGLAVGIVFAALLSSVAVLFSLGCEDSPGNCIRWPIRPIVAAYFSAGIVGGIATGLASALGSSWPARCVSGIALALPLSFAVSVAMYGSPQAWSLPRWRTTLVAGALLGAAVGLTTSRTVRTDFH